MELASSFESRIELTELRDKTNEIRKEAASIIVGQQSVFDLLLTAVLADGHVLIEGVPGIAKTLVAKVVAQLISARFTRIQCTPDLMPSDVLGTAVFNMKDSSFEFKKGPLFSNIILIDEINRSPAKTQSALFEVMEERQITMDGLTHKMDPFYLVVATQNPIEQEGTYKLPEAQLDRFLFKINMGYPELKEEIDILEKHHENRHLTDVSALKACVSMEEILGFRKKAATVHVGKNLLEYIAKIIQDTRGNPAIYLGASPRAGVAIMNGAKAFAALNGRDFVTPEDVQFVIAPAINHRIMLSSEAEMEGLSAQEICKRIVDKIEVPR